MALKQLMLNSELSKKKKELEELRAKKAEFERREAELAAALDEATENDELETLSAEVDKLDSEYKEADVENKAAEVQAEIERIETELSELENRAKESKSAERAEKYTGGRTMNKKTIFGALPEETRAKIMARGDVKAFLERVKTVIVEKRTVSGADLLVPEVILDLIRNNLDKYSEVIRRVSVSYANGTARQPISGAIPEGIWTEMIADFNEADISFNAITFDGYKVAAFIAIPNSTLDDGGAILLAEITENLTEGIAKGVTRAILYGTGNTMPLGIATRLAQTSQPSDWGTDAPTWADLHSTHIIKENLGSTTGAAFFAALAKDLALAEGKGSSRAPVWIMNRKTKATILANSLNSNSAGLMVMGFENRMPGDGGEIIECDIVPDYDIIGGYLDRYKLVEREGTSVRPSDQVRFLNDQTVFAAKARYDGKPVFGECFVLININNINPTTSTTFPADSKNTDRVSLSALTIGATPITLTPAFNKDILNYAGTVTAHSQKITATALTQGATIVIKNGDTPVTNGSNATFTAGSNTLTVEVTNGNAAKRTYTVTVTDETT